MKKIMFLSFALLLSAFAINAQHIDTASVTLEKELLYNQHTLPDTYEYNKTPRSFQWDKIKLSLAQTDALRAENCCNEWAVLQNKSNLHGQPANAKEFTIDEYRSAVDRYGISANQAIPLFLADDLKVPERYAPDGSLVKIMSQPNSDFAIVQVPTMEGQYYVQKKYIHLIEGVPDFVKVIVVDRENQNISTYERVNNVWKVRSMNPATTGAHHPPYQKPTPLGMFVLQAKTAKMQFLADGTNTIAGYCPWANRFTAGAYIHGVPVNLPATAPIEFSATLGTIPRSHMCVRNATSHSKFIYDNFPIDETLVFVIE